MMTRYHEGALASDSDIDDGLGSTPVDTVVPYPLTGREEAFESAIDEGTRAEDGQIILAAPKDADATLAADKTTLVTVPHNQVISDATGSVVFDIMRARADRYDGGDAGELPVPTRSLTGRVWRDADYDGLQDMKTTEEVALPDGSTTTKLVEEGLKGQIVTLEQWYYDPDAVNPDSAPVFQIGRAHV